MTVCIAAIASWPKGGQAIIGASDRMITASYGEIEYEPPTSKIFKITDNIIVMIAGEMTVQLEIIEELQRQDNKGILIKKIAEKIATLYEKQKLDLAEKIHLSRFGLTMEGFLKTQKELDPLIVKDLYEKINCVEIQAIESIVTGWDEWGAHIYVVKNDRIINCDHEGFASIGIGEHHANSQMMLARYSPLVEVEKAVPLIYIAKKRSQIAAGVGDETDMFISNRGTITDIKHELLRAKLEETYKNMKTKEDEVFNGSLVEIQKFINDNVYTKNEPELPLTHENGKPQETSLLNNT